MIVGCDGPRTVGVRYDAWRNGEYQPYFILRESSYTEYMEEARQNNREVSDYERSLAQTTCVYFYDVSVD
jgi:hypothetical protein